MSYMVGSESELGSRKIGEPEVNIIFFAGAGVGRNVQFMK